MPSSVRGHELEEVGRSTKKRKARKPSERTLTEEKHAYLYWGGEDNCLYALGQIMYYKHVQETNNKTSPLSPAFFKFL